MQLTILAFGITKDIVGGSSIQVDIPENQTVASLKDWLGNQYPAMKELQSLLIAVNEEYGDETHVLMETDEVALIPPVSGG